MSDSTHEIILKNSYIYDAKNKINGEVKDLLIRDGKIVDSLKSEQDAQEIDARGCITFSGFIDLRTHMFAQETMYHNLLTRSYDIRFEYSKVAEIERIALNRGFTSLIEMDVPINQSKITLNNMGLSTILDHGMIFDIGSNWSFLGEMESESAVNHVGNIMSFLIETAKGLGLSINCPYHQNYWKLQEIPYNTKIPMIPLSLKQIYTLLIKAAVENEINPHFVAPYNIEDSSLNHMGFLNSIEENKFTLSSANRYFLDNFSEFVKFHASHEKFSCEITPFSLGFTYPLITRDRNFALRESKTSGIPMQTIDLEFDTEIYITGRKIETNNNKLGKWVELLADLKRKSNLNRVFLSSNAPYQMSISDWSKKIAETIKPETGITLFDLSALLSANPARLIGLGDRKGHLGTGADADIVCFTADPEKISVDSFTQPKILIKKGYLVINNSEFSIPSEPIGRIFWKSGEYKKDSMEIVKKRLNNFYDKRFSMHLNALENSVTPRMEKI